MKHSHKKSFDWYSMQQRYSIRKYHFGAASVLLGTALVLGTAANAQSVQAEEQHPEATNSVSVDKVDEATKPAEVSIPKKETTYAAPTVANPVETTPAKTEEATRPAEKVEEAKDKKEEVTHQDAVDKSKLLTALSRAKKLESKLYTEASAANLQASIQAGQSLLGKADATEVELSAAESSIQSAIIGLELRSNSDKGTVSETPVVKKADTAEAKEEAKPAARTTDRSAVDSSVLATNAPAKVETTSAPKSTNELLKPALSLSDARQNPAIRKEDLDKGHSGFRAASNPANPIVSGSGNTVAFTDISQGGRSYSFRGYGNSRGGNSIHYDVTTVRQGNRLNFTIRYSGPGEFVNNNFILDKGDGFGNPSNATITTPRLREQSKPISQGANFVSHSGYSMTSATSTNMEQTIRFSLPIINPNGDLSVRLKPVTFNVDQGGGGAATSNDPYSNSNYYYRANPLLLDANPNGGTSNKTVTEELEFQTIYLPTSKLPEGETRLVREGEKGQRQITYKVHRLGNETILGLPISNRVTKEAKPRIVQIGVAKEFIETVKPRVDQNKIGDTNNLTFYLDNDGNGVYTEGVDELVQRIAIKDGAKGEKGDQGERGLTGAKGEKGDRGERGLTGAQGAKGEKGDRGERGLTGAQGAKGEKGDQGERGLTGAQGAKGEKGDQGERGLTGAQGAKGEKGDRGERGLTGAQGAKGEKGDRGERGLTGAQGAKGEKGDQGERGLTGAQGAKGEKGDRGERGLTGAQGAKGEKGDQGQAGRDGVTPTVTVKDNKEDGTHTITINDGRGNVTSTVVRDGFDGASPLVATQRNDADKTTTVIFYYDQNDNNEFDAGDTKLKEVVIADGAKGEKGDQGERGLTGAQGAKGDRGERGETGAAGRDGKTPVITTARGKDGHSTDITFTIPGEEPVVANIKDGKDGRTPTIDLNALAEAAARLNNQRSGRVRRALADDPSTAPAEKPREGTLITAYFDNNGNGRYDEGIDELIAKQPIYNGTDGANGAAGAAGRNGAELLSGPKPPTSNDGKDGDTYIDATTGDVYKKENGTWDKIGNIRGPQGLKGEAGVAGPQGPQGPKGDQGAQGLQGRDGAQGPAGRDGRDGKDVLNGKVDPTTEGKDGDKYVNTETGDVFVKNNGTWEKEGNIKGPKGDKGAEGAQGPKGADGAQGLPGRDGRDGAQGPAGRDGRDGRDGKDVLNGKVDPTTEGKDGDKYVNTETGDVFVKNNGNWEKEGNIKGPKGDKGAEGAQGPKGADGAQGLPGRDGRDGAQGPAGRDGKDVLNGKVDPTTEGKDGDKYVNTETGDVFVKNNGTWEKEGNIKGPKGDKGAEGAQGPKGADGAQGLPGRDGRDGAQGPAGRDGRDGRDGKDVLNGKVDPTTEGKDGDKYVNTETGDVFVKNNGNWEKEGNIKGPKGDKGAEGAQGPKGADGAQGLPGRDGRDGAQGPAGRDGKDVLNGKVDPTTEGKDGDKYVNTETGDVFVKNNGNWEKEGNIKGPKGDKGAEGAQGPKGADGAQGLPGRDGRDGAQGPAGRDGKDVLNGKVDPTTEGKDGDKYVNTETGDVFVKNNGNWEKEGNIKGPKGDQGAQGLQGRDGREGVQGPAGRDGRDGAQGPAGRDGRDGKDVLNGKVDPTTEGKDGDKYVNTETGDVFVKNNGNWEKEGNIKGPKGDKGAEGAQGPKGADGAQGLPGRDGRDGAQGPAGRDGRDGRDGKDVLNGKVDPTTEGKDGDKYVNTETGDVFVKNNGNWEKEGNIKGPKGDKGAEGAQGPKGADGAQGLPGRDGRDGAQGPAGRDGRDGRDGKDVLNGKVDPTTEGKDGDKYVNTETGDVFVKNNGTWEKEGNIKGPKGDKGADGAQGLPGRDGRDGAQGPAGRDGRDGKDVLNGKVDPTTEGKDGDKYVNTETGDVFVKNNGTWEKEGNIKGPKGDQGAQGLQGRDGREGVQGPAGRDGRDGAQGPAGRDGRDGKDVLNGKVDPTTEGKDGDKYVNTETGDVFVKNNGNWEKEGNIKGPKGDKGAEGAQGPKGADGAQGLPGRDGRDGAAGRDGRDGRDGKDVLNGKVDPTTEGKDGDKYVNTETGDVFVKNNGTWEKEGNIKGPKGDKGERGEDGKTPEVTVTPGKDGHSTDITFTVPGKDPVTVNVKNGENGLNGKTPKVDLLRVEGQNGNPSHTIVTFYTDENNDGKYTPGTDELLGSEMIKDGAKGADGRDGKSLLTVKDGKETKVYQEDPAHPGQPLNPEKPLAVIKDGVDGVSPTVTAVRKDEEGHKGVEITVDNHDGSQPTTVFVKDGAKGETGATGQDGQTPTITTQRGQDGQSTLVTITTPGKDPVTFTVKDGKNGRDGRTPTIDLNALVEAVRRGAGSTSNSQPSGTSRSARNRRALSDEDRSATESSETVQPTTTDATDSQPVNGTRITAYYDNNGNGKYDPGVDELIGTSDILNGTNGRNGTNGASGHDGRDGRNGAELLSGVTAPTAKDGKDGDTYIDANTGDVYKKENGSWNKIGNIRGPQGTAGEKGATGEKGEKGDNGKDGRAPKIKVEDITSPSRSRRATDATATPTRTGIRVTVYDDKNDNGVFDDGDTVLNTKDIYNGIDGRDGSAPTITTKDNGDGTHTITVQNPDGSESTTVVKDGKDGKTANITTTENPDGSHTITVTNPDGTTKETVVKNGKDGKTPKVEVTDNNDGTHTVKVTDGDGNITNAIIKDGKDGKAATATTTENPDGSHRVTITNPDGTKNEFVVKNGRDGVDGRTPTASVRDNGDGSHTIVITNPEGVTTETTVRDGKSPKVTITDEQNGTHKISVLNGDGTTTETIIKDGKSPVATVTDNHDGTYTIRVENGNGTVSETTVRDGKSPTAKVVDNGDGTHTITVVNSDGTTTTTTVRDGKEPKLEVIDNNNGSHTIKVTGADGKETTTTIFDGKSPKANIVDNGDGTHTLTIVDSDGREYKSIIKDGKDGKDGVSPTVTVKNNNDGTHVVTITNPDGSKTEMVIKDGKDGKSPKVSVEDNGDGSHTITIINSDGTVTKTVIKDGKDGRDGRDGRDGKDGKCGCQDKPVTPSNDKPVPPTPNMPEGPTFAMPEPPVHELPEFNGGVPGMPEVHELPEFNGGVPGMPEVNELPNPEVPGMPTPPVHEIPEFNGGVPGMPEVNDKPTSNIPEVPTQPNPNVPVQPVTPLTSNPVVPTTGKEKHGDKLPETGSQSDYISVLLGSGILLSLYVGRRKED